MGKIIYKKVTGHGSINVPIAIRRELGIEVGDAMEVEVTDKNEIGIRPYRVRCQFCNTDETVTALNGKGICSSCLEKIKEKKYAKHK